MTKFFVLFAFFAVHPSFARAAKHSTAKTQRAQRSEDHSVQSACIRVYPRFNLCCGKEELIRIILKSRAQFGACSVAP
jgi:hypothetical protein